MCRLCLRSVEKLHKLKETKKLDDDIRQKMERVMEPYIIQQVDDPVQFCTPLKRLPLHHREEREHGLLTRLFTIARLCRCSKKAKKARECVK